MISWHKVYRELAEKLAIYYSVNRINTGELLFDRCIKNKNFIINNSWILRFKKDFDVKSIDPIHIFSSFNESNISDDERIKRINSFSQLLPNSKEYNLIDFNGCPAPFSIKIMSARKSEVQNDIWSVFYKILQENQGALNQTVFNKLINWYGIDISAFTIFLFWIDSDNFLPLDKNTNRFLKEANILSQKPKTFDDYKRLIPQKNVTIYRKITLNSYNKNESKNNIGFFFKEVQEFYKRENSKNQNKIDFKIIAIKPIKDTSNKYFKVLKPNYTYTFYNSYDLTNENNIKYDSNKDLKLFKIEEEDYVLDVNVSAIVGKNGSGKSSITELLYLAINNMARKVFGFKSKLTVEDVSLELFYYTDTVYKLKIEGHEISLFKYQNNISFFSNKKEVPLDKETLTSFFYTVAINYSHYALNSLEIGDWINHLFHKNDRYQIPLVINPMRIEGNVDINIENSLVKSRLLSNLLEPVSLNNKANLREITENKRKVNELILKLNKEKIKYLFDKTKFPQAQYVNTIISKVYSHFHIYLENKNEITRCADKYIFKKLVNISRNYTSYKKYYNSITKEFKLNSFIDYLIVLENDDSHITYKLKQAINYLKYGHLKHITINKKKDINVISNSIQKVIENNYPKVKLKTIELIPPSFFDVEILLEDGSSFEKLSSGEKQKIHTVSSLVYHLSNLNSVIENKTLTKYSYVNIIFDEVELYFHPDMQRNFINFLFNYLRKIRFNNIDGLNFCFITHSPFILSDIPSENVMFIEKENEKDSSSKTIQIDAEKNNIKTFGANVHDLLTSSFFMEKGYVGAFAKDKIIELIKEINDIPKNSLKQKDTVSLINRINIIGEPFIKSKLLEAVTGKIIFENELQNNIRLKEIELKQLRDKLKGNKKNDKNSTP